MNRMELQLVNRLRKLAPLDGETITIGEFHVSHGSLIHIVGSGVGNPEYIITVHDEAVNHTMMQIRYQQRQDYELAYHARATLQRVAALDKALEFWEKTFAH